jgi:Protein of unknown function (DUF3175)
MATTSTPRKKTPRKTTRTTKRKVKVNRWSQRVTDTSDALDLQDGLFKSRSAKAIAAGLKRAAERSQHKKGSPYQSAMSMLNFYMNRGGKQITSSKKETLERAKGELRTLFGRA